MKTIQIAAYKKLSDGEIVVSHYELDKKNWERVSEFEEWEPEPIVDRPYYMKNEYELINDKKEFGLRDMYMAYNAGAVAHFQKPRMTSCFNYFVELAKKRGWINEE